MKGATVASVSSGIKMVIIALIGLFLIWNTVTNAAPAVFGNDTPVVWIMGVDIGWVGLLLPYIVAAIVIFAILVFL